MANFDAKFGHAPLQTRDATQLLLAQFIVVFLCALLLQPPLVKHPDGAVAVPLCALAAGVSVACTVCAHRTFRCPA